MKLSSHVLYPSVGAIRLLFVGMFVSLVSPLVRADESYHLDRIAVVKFTEAPENKLQFHEGVMFMNGTIQWRPSRVVDRPNNVQPWTLGRNLIRHDDHTAYYRLGYGAFHNFDLFEDGGVGIYFGATEYHTVRPSTQGFPLRGKLVNISTRFRLGAGGASATAGFVVNEHARKVLIRAIGPTLQLFWVPNPLADPKLTVMKDGVAIHVNDNWSAAPDDAQKIPQVSAHAGAFPLNLGSKDAATVLDLAPGAYTVLVQSAIADTVGGEVMVEVYSVPVDFFLSE